MEESPFWVGHRVVVFIIFDALECFFIWFLCQLIEVPSTTRRRDVFGGFVTVELIIVVSRLCLFSFLSSTYFVFIIKPVWNAVKSQNRGGIKSLLITKMECDLSIFGWISSCNTHLCRVLHPSLLKMYICRNICSELKFIYILFFLLPHKSLTL